MPEITPTPIDGPSASAKRWLAWRAAVKAVADEDRQTIEAARAARDERVEREYRNPVAFWAGIAILLILLLGGLYFNDRLRCDPNFSDNVHRHACP